MVYGVGLPVLFVPKTTCQAGPFESYNSVLEISKI